MDSTVLIIGSCLVAMTLANLATTFRLLQAMGDMSLKLLADRNTEAATMVADHVERRAKTQRVTSEAETPQAPLDDGFQGWGEQFARDINTPFEHGGNGQVR